MQHTLSGKRVLITQADEFMGPALCEVFAEQGAEVVASMADAGAARSRGPGGGPACGAGPIDVLVANLALPGAHHAGRRGDRSRMARRVRRPGGPAAAPGARSCCPT